MHKFNPFDYFFLLRPLILIPSWNFLLIGAYLARQKANFDSNLVLGIVIYTCVMGGVYILNQLMDIETDKVNKKLFLLSKGIISPKNAWFEIVILWLIAVFLSLKFGLIFLFLIILSLVLGVLYSLPPVKLKGKPLLDTLANSLGYGVVNFSVGWLLVAPGNSQMFYRFLPYVFSIAAVFINTTIVDIKGDKKSGEITSAVFLGAERASILSTGLIALAIFYAWRLHDPVCLIPVASSFPLFIYNTVYLLLKKKAKRKIIIASFRLPGLIFTLITAFLYPVYILILVIIFVSMRIYYRRRFGIVYPTLSQG